MCYLGYIYLGVGMAVCGVRLRGPPSQLLSFKSLFIVSGFREDRHQQVCFCYPALGPLPL